MPKRVAIEESERTGTDNHKLVELLVHHAVADPSKFWYHTILRVNPIGPEDAGFKRTAEDIRVGDRNQIEARVPRVHELGATYPTARPGSITSLFVRR
jgi:ferritin-like protein